MPYFPTQAATLPAPSDTAQHNLFTRERQVRFLEALSVSGNVRAACRSACIAPQTAYRLRRADAQFAQAWTAACLAARAHVEAVLADRALNGVEEAVFYHGEEVARRRRFDSRLLLAHLARLDKLAESAELADLAQDYDSALDAFREHGTLRPPEPAPAPLYDAADDRFYDDEEDEAGYGAQGGYGDTDDAGGQGLGGQGHGGQGHGGSSYGGPTYESQDYGNWRTRFADAPRPCAKSARELDVPDLYRLDAEDFAFLYDRLMAQKDAAPTPEDQPPEDQPAPEAPSAPRDDNTAEAEPAPQAEVPPPREPSATPKIIDFPTFTAPAPLAWSGGSLRR